MNYETLRANTETKMAEPSFIEIERAPQSDADLYRLLAEELDTRRRHHHNCNVEAERVAKERAAAELALETCKRALDALGYAPEQRS